MFSDALRSPWRVWPWSDLSPCSRCCWLLFRLKESPCYRFYIMMTVIKIDHYNDEWPRWFAGISVCGSGVGTFIFAPLATWLLEQWVLDRDDDGGDDNNEENGDGDNDDLHLVLFSIHDNDALNNAQHSTIIWSRYGWKGANIIFAGLCLQCAVRFFTQLVQIF